MALSAQNERLEAQVERLSARVARQDERIAHRERRLGRSSRNSSQPPSADPPGAGPRRGKDPSGRRQGGQPGHVNPQAISAAFSYLNVYNHHNADRYGHAPPRRPLQGRADAGGSRASRRHGAVGRRRVGDRGAQAEPGDAGTTARGLRPGSQRHRPAADPARCRFPGRARGDDPRGSRRRRRAERDSTGLRLRRRLPRLEPPRPQRADRRRAGIDGRSTV